MNGEPRNIHQLLSASGPSTIGRLSRPASFSAFSR
jgi:hypothetical protein